MGQQVGDAKVGLLESNPRRTCFQWFNPIISLKGKLVRFTIYGLCLIYLLFLYLSSSWFHDQTKPIHTINPLPRINNYGYYASISNLKENLACHFPTLKPFDESIQKFVKDPGPLKCSEVPEKENKHQFKYNFLFETDFNSNLIMKQNVVSYGFESCCYKGFTRKSENGIKYSGSCEPIAANSTQISSQHEFVVVFCSPAPENQEHFETTEGKLKKVFSRNETTILTTNSTLGPALIGSSGPLKNVTVATSAVNESQAVLTPVDMFNFVRLKPDVEERIQNISKNNAEKLNVLILGLDSISHMNLIRTMPKSYGYMTQDMETIGMNGYTKVGENTFPNMLAALMGHNEPELDSICWNRTKNGYFDECPFIWKNFSQEGYRTSFAEDSTSMGIFNYIKKGFKNPPTDYYLRTLTYSMDKLIGHVGNTHLCYGPRLAFSILLENIRKLVHVMGKERRYFQFTWATSLFHDKLNYPARGDTTLQETFKWLLEEGHLENTVLIFMSDHGIRYGAIRDTFQGKVEESMPFLYFRFPKWFIEKYRSAVSNLKLNRNRLTTPFDLYETLKDLLHLTNIGNNVLRERHDKLRSITNIEMHPRGISLFLPIPTSRTCESAGIPPNYCVCHQMKPISIEEDVVQEAASAVVDSLNQMLQKFPQCAKLRLKEVTSSQVMLLSANSTEAKVVSDVSPNTYSVTIVTLPGEAKFEATMSVSHGMKRTWSTEGSISRINEYGTQSHCATEYTLKMYCFCQ